MSQLLLQRERPIIGKNEIRVVLDTDELKRDKYRKEKLKEIRKVWHNRGNYYDEGYTGPGFYDELDRLRVELDKPGEYDDVVLTLNLSEKDYQYVQKYHNVWDGKEKSHINGIYRKALNRLGISDDYRVSAIFKDSFVGEEV